MRHAFDSRERPAASTWCPDPSANSYEFVLRELFGCSDAQVANLTVSGPLQ
ncbi:MAG: hypothetical protein ACKVVT_05810 [Dehalococcoidia bacterium]